MLIYGQNRSINLNVKINATGGARATPRIRRSELTGLQARLKQSPGGSVQLSGTRYATIGCHLISIMQL